MSDLSFTNDAWLSKLRNHLDTEQYGAGTVSQYMGVARRFLADLEKQNLSIDAAQPASIERYLQQTPWVYPLRHQHSQDYKHWRRTAIYMLLRLAQGQWPPDSRLATPVEVSQQKICEEYSRWLLASRGLARTTVVCRCNEARRFLGGWGSVQHQTKSSF